MNTRTPSFHAAETPDALAIVMGTSGETVTYAELDDRSRRFAQALVIGRVEKVFAKNKFLVIAIVIDIR